MQLLQHLAIIAAHTGIVFGSSSSLSCFVEYDSSSTVKNACERAYYSDLEATDADACADTCVADANCIMFLWSEQTKPKCRLSSTCKAPTNALPGYQGYFRNSTVGACDPKSIPGEAWERVFLSDAARNGAVCLDGSPGAYYIRTNTTTGRTPDPNKWIVFMEGGGWCANNANCVGRSHTDLGSSKGYPTVPRGLEADGIGGLYASYPFENHTVVYAKYCDGGSWTGAYNTAPVQVGNETIYFRGKALLDGLFDHLFKVQGLDKATELLWAGCSAGGLTTYIHADWVTEQMQDRAPAAKVVALADAMFSLNHDDVEQDGHWPRFMQFVYHANDAADAVNQDCVSYMADTYGTPKGNRSEGWRCMFGTAVAKYVQTPLFVLNSKYDTWQGAQIISAGKCASNISTCSANVTKFWVDYGHLMVEFADALPERHGVYIHNCPSHCQTGPGSWTTDTVRNTVMGQSVAAWYAAALVGKQAGMARHIDRCDVHPCLSDICDGVPAPAPPALIL